MQPELLPEPTGPMTHRTMSSQAWKRLRVGDAVYLKLNVPAAIADYRRAAERQPRPRCTDPWDSIAQLSRLSGNRESEAEAYEHIIAILQEDWSLGECETVRGYRRNLAECR